ncbi:MAG TPA: hypothetical protein VK453_20150 [Micromonosporaceae bacterium]|nr:hypothetical protein [Micromonosporaceae bacterium]
MPVAVLAGTLFLLNVIARLVVRLAAGKDADKQAWLGAIAFLVVGAVMIGAAYWWARRHPMPRVVADLLIAALVGCLLGSLLGPFVSSGEAFAGGIGAFLARFGYYLAVAALGALFGLLLVTALGQDYKAQALKRYAETVRARPRRVVRR